MKSWEEFAKEYDAKIVKICQPLEPEFEGEPSYSFSKFLLAVAIAAIVVGVGMVLIEKWMGW